MLFFVIIIVFICGWINGEYNESIIRQIRPLSSLLFDEIVINGAFDIYLSSITNESSKPTVEIETRIDIQKHIIVEIIDNHILYIHMNGSFEIDKNVYSYIRFGSPLRRYTVKGHGNTMSDDYGISNSNDEIFVVEHYGVGNLAIGLNVQEFRYYFTGTGNSRFWGQVRSRTEFNAKGIGDINSLNLSTKTAEISVSGISIIRVIATEDLQIEITGISSVYYQLPPGKTPSKSISTGPGKIVPMS